MNNDILISVIVPVFRTEKYLKKCADSLLAQSFQNFEVIFVDDGSDDSCPMICDYYCNLDNRFKAIHKKNEGLGLGRNSGLEIIRGDYFTFLDSDDWYDIDHLRKLADGTQKGLVDLVIGGCKSCTEEKVVHYSRVYKKGLIENEKIIDDILLPIIAPSNGEKIELSIPMSVCFNLYRTSIAKKNNLIFLSERDTVGEDLFFNLSFLRLCKTINYLDWHGYNYRMNENSISMHYNPLRLKRTENFYALIKQHINNLELEDKVGYRVERCTLSKFRAALRLAATSPEGIRYQYIECKKILNSDVLQHILRIYPIDTYRKSLKITSILMKYKFVLLIILAFKIDKLNCKK